MELTVLVEGNKIIVPETIRFRNKRIRIIILDNEIDQEESTRSSQQGHDEKISRLMKMAETNELLRKLWKDLPEDGLLQDDGKNWREKFREAVEESGKYSQ